jgi:CBS domain containing-hemolysin-like protein
MNLEEWLPWLVVAVSAIVHTLTTLVLSAYPSRTFTIVTNPTEPTNGSTEIEPIRQLDTRARVVVIGLQAISLIAGTLAAADGLTTEGNYTASNLVIAGAGALVARLALHGLASFVAHRYREQTRRITQPFVWAVSQLSSVPGTAWLATVITGRTAGDETAGQEASEALKESLDFLEESQIPANESELQMIRGILRMDTVKVREIMRPRPDMIITSVDASTDELMNLMTVGGHSKIPVYSESPDNIVGVIYARDLLSARAEGTPDDGLTRKLARPAIHVPESQNLERLLREFQEHRTSIAMVVDEYGSIAGLVTVTDLIEEIVGELVDEFDVEGPEIQQVSATELVADAAISIDSLNRALGGSIHAEGFDTVGGLVLKELGRIPSSGDRVRVGDLVITVQSTVGRRIRRVRIVKEPLLPMD